MIRLFTIAGVLLTFVAQAQADISPNDVSIQSFNPDDAVAPTSTVEGPGIKVGEGTVLRPVFGVETGFVSNVFYQDNDTTGSGVLRLIAQIGAASLGEDRLTQHNTDTSDQPQTTNQGDFEYRASARLSYDLMLSGNDAVSETGGLGAGLTLHGLVNPMGRFRLGLDDDFMRLIRAANFETDANTNRDINTFRLTGFYSPPDRSVSGYIYYSNVVDIFERGTQRFADRMFNRAGLHPIWQWLPHTQVYGDFSWGWTTGIGSSSTKVDSYPMNVLLGVSTLFTLTTTFNMYAGYTNGFYSAGPSYSSPMFGANLGWRYSPLGRATLGYMYLHDDSINANFYRDHVIRASFQQLFVPFVAMVQPEIHLRQYEGVTVAVPGIMGPDVRDDLIIAVIAGVHYNFRNWLAATMNYRFTSAQTDYTYMINGFVDDPSFTRHELLVGVRAAL